MMHIDDDDTCIDIEGVTTPMMISIIKIVSILTGSN